MAVMGSGSIPRAELARLSVFPADGTNLPGILHPSIPRESDRLFIFIGI
jgi:hypothetical protein